MKPGKNDFLGMHVMVNFKDGDQRNGFVYDYDGDTLLVSCGGETVRVPRSTWEKWKFNKVRMVLP